MASLLDIGKNLKNRANPIIQGILDSTDLDERVVGGYKRMVRPRVNTTRLNLQTAASNARYNLPPFFNQVGQRLQQRGFTGNIADLGTIGMKMTKNPYLKGYIESSTRAPAKFVQGVTFGLSPNTLTQPAQTNSAKVTDFASQMYGSALSPITKGIVKATDPLAARATQRLAPKLASTIGPSLAPRIATGVANVAQGLGFDAAYRTAPTPLSVGADFAMGIVGGPRMFGKPIAKGMDQGRTTKIEWDPEDSAILDRLRGALKNKKIEDDELENIDSWMKILADGYLKKTEIDRIAGKWGSNRRKMLEEMGEVMFKRSKDAPQLRESGYVDDMMMGITGKKPQSTVGGVSKPRGASDTNPLLPPLKAQTDQKLPPQADSATKQIQSVPQKTEPQISKDVVEGNVKGNLSSLDIIPPTDPIQKIITALKEAKPIRGAQEGMYRKARSQKFAKMMSARGRVGGEKGFFAEKGALKGELPKAQFESLRDSLKQSDIDTLFNKVNEANIGDWEKITAKTGLAKILGQEGGSVPTKGEIALLDEVYGREFTDALLDKRPLMQKLMATMGDVLNLPRSLMASVDMSAPLRQGVFLIGRPKQWAPAFKEMVKSFGSEKAYQAVLDDIAAKPTYKLMREHKLALTQANSKLATGEEAFMSNLAERIPGIGRVVKSSDRAYTGFLNKLRADTFEDMVMRGRDIGLDDDPVFLQSAADFVNAATGRGKLPGALANSAQALNGVFFSPRLMASRLTLLNPVSYVTMHPQVRKEALKSLFTFAGTGMTVLTLAQLAGAEVGKDPRSSDFGKIKIGNTRYDIWGGFQQYIKAASQILSGKLISSTTGKEYTLGEGYKPITRLDIATKFFESKEAPIASFITSMLRGENAIGDKFSLPEELISRMTPMMIQDMYDLQKEWGPKGMLMGIPGIFGVGSQTYGKQIPVQETTEAGNPTIKLKSVPGFAEDVVRKFTKEPVSNIPQDQWQGIVDAKNEEKQKGLIKEQLKQSGGAQVVGNSYIYINDKGEAKEIDLDRIQNIPTYPTLTGDANLDKEAVSRYKSTLSSITNDVYDLWEMGKLTTEEASALLDNVQTAYSQTKKAKKPKKISIKKSKSTPYKLAKSKKIKFSQKKLPKPKITKTKGYRILTYTDNAPKVKVSKPVVRWS